MKIGIITFHWGANHGAVLQAYALSRFLEIEYNADVEIIDYYPKNLENKFFNAIRCRRPRVFINKLKEIRKECYIKPFRQNLKLSKRYYTNSELINTELDYDVLITGSDQVWNPSFLRCGEKKITPVYFLNFGDDNVRKISVSASFGCQTFPDDCQKVSKPLLEAFDAISVREKSGEKILADMGIQSVITADPTALLSGEEYMKLCSTNPSQRQGTVKMILRKQSKRTQRLIDSICDVYSSGKTTDIQCLSIVDWLSAIHGSSMVITNSFHCVMMCLKLHTPFVVVLEDGGLAGMNDRFMTLLEQFEMTDRIIMSVDDIKAVPTGIDFEKVDVLMGKYADSLKSFLKRNIG